MAAIDRLDEHVCDTSCLPLPEWEDLPRTQHAREWVTALGTLPFFIVSQLWRHLRHRIAR